MITAALLGMTAVMLDAFGAHALESWLEQQTDLAADLRTRRLDVFHLAAQYQLIHAVALLASQCLTGPASRAAAVGRWAWLIGIALFSGFLYLYGATGDRALARPVPVGGISLITGWALLTWSFCAGHFHRTTDSDSGTM